jgi:hypothetical protein
MQHSTSSGEGIGRRGPEGLKGRFANSGLDMSYRPCYIKLGTRGRRRIGGIDGRAVLDGENRRWRMAHDVIRSSLTI